MSTRIWSLVVIICGLVALAGCGTSTSVSSSGWTAKRESDEATQPQQQPRFTVTLQQPVSADVSGTGVTVSQILEGGDKDLKYRAILDAPANTTSLATLHFDTGGEAPTVEVQAGRAYLWGIFPSGRTRRVVTASQAVGALRVQAAEHRKVIFQIDGDTHRVVNVDKESPIFIRVWNDSAVDNGQPLHEIPPRSYRNVTIGEGGDAANPPVEIGESINWDQDDTDQAKAVKDMVEEMEAKQKEFEKQ